VEVIDPRSLVPMDADTIRNSVRKTGRLVIADEAGPTAGASAEIAALVSEDATTFGAMKTALERVCALPVPVPYAPGLEDHVFPDRERIAAAVRRVMAGG
jgi:pyruvate dehydrogenase E1 component beta subunit